ncbi:Uncharacterised protein [Klebsiella pneumoniae]|nr:Uncharacterised protein [Klebsiella pneumoniae]
MFNVSLNQFIYFNNFIVCQRFSILNRKFKNPLQFHFVLQSIKFIYFQ